MGGSTLKYSALILQNDPVGTVQLRLTQPPNATPLSNGVLLKLPLTTEDLIQIKGTPGFAVSNQTTWLSGDDGVVKNMGNITSDAFAALRVRNLIVDNTNPVLKTFVLNLDASTLTLEATEPLETSDFQVECIALSSDGDQTSLVNLTGSEAITQNGQFTIINMTATDLEALKLSNF